MASHHLPIVQMRPTR